MSETQPGRIEGGPVRGVVDNSVVPRKMSIHGRIYSGGVPHLVRHHVKSHTLHEEQKERLMKAARAREANADTQASLRPFRGTKVTASRFAVGDTLGRGEGSPLQLNSRGDGVMGTLQRRGNGDERLLRLDAKRFSQFVENSVEPLARQSHGREMNRRASIENRPSSFQSIIKRGISPFSSSSPHQRSREATLAETVENSSSLSRSALTSPAQIRGSRMLRASEHFIAQSDWRTQLRIAEEKHLENLRRREEEEGVDGKDDEEEEEEEEEKKERKMIRGRDRAEARDEGGEEKREEDAPTFINDAVKGRSSERKLIEPPSKDSENPFSPIGREIRGSDGKEKKNEQLTSLRTDKNNQGEKKQGRIKQEDAAEMMGDEVDDEAAIRRARQLAEGILQDTSYATRRLAVVAKGGGAPSRREQKRRGRMRMTDMSRDVKDIDVDRLVTDTAFDDLIRKTVFRAPPGPISVDALELICELVASGQAVVSDNNSESSGEGTIDDSADDRIGSSGSRCCINVPPALRRPPQMLRSLSLAALHLDNVSLGDEGTRLLADALATSQQRRSSGALRSLSLRDNHISPIGARALGRALCLQSGLTRLDIEDNKLRAEGAQALSSALLINHRRISALHIGGNAIGDDGVRSIAAALLSQKPSRNALLYDIPHYLRRFPSLASVLRHGVDSVSSGRRVESPNISEMTLSVGGVGTVSSGDLEERDDAARAKKNLEQVKEEE